MATSVLAIGCAAVNPSAPAEQCPVLFRAPLGDVAAAVAATGETPDVAIAWSPDGARLAVGTSLGALVVYDTEDWSEVWRREFPEAIVKRLAFSGDGALFVGEQSPDADVREVDARDGADRWVWSLGGRLGRAAWPAADDIWGAYQLPGVSALFAEPDGVVVVGVRGWSEDGAHRNQAQVVRLDRAGRAVAAFPAEPAELTFLSARAADGRIALAVGHSSARPAPADAPVGGVWVLDASLSPVAAHVLTPLQPEFSSVFIWDALAFGGGALGVGAGDGRWVDLDGAAPVTRPLGTPVRVGGVPVAASVGFGGVAHPWRVAVTSGSNIPFGAAAPELQPPAAHPGADRIWWWGPGGEGSWHGPVAPTGFAPTELGFVVGAGPPSGQDRADLFGVLDFEAGADVRLRRFCRTPGPPHFRIATSQGRIALAEGPRRRSDGTVSGTHSLTVFGPPPGKLSEMP